MRAMRETATFDYEGALAACARGERYALKAIYDREARWLFAVALRIVRHRQRAEDVLQDAFLQVWSRASTFNAELGSGRGWIYTIVRHRALREVRDKTVEVDIDDELVQAQAEQTLAQGASSDGFGVDSGSLQRCLGLLDEQRRSCIVHAYVDGYTHEQIATQLETPLGTVKSAIRRGLKSLKECLS